MNILTVSSGYRNGSVYMSFFPTKNPNFRRDLFDLFGPFSSTWWDIDPPVRWCWRWHICMRVTSCHGAQGVSGPLTARHPWHFRWNTWNPSQKGSCWWPGLGSSDFVWRLLGVYKRSWWWCQFFSIFPPIFWGDDPIWPIFFRWVVQPPTRWVWV